MSRLRWPDSTNSVSEKPGTIHLVIEMEPQPGRAVARKPDLGVLAMRALRPVAILALEERGDPMVIPLELLVPIAGHGERALVLVVARDVLVDGQDEVEPAAEEQVAFRADRVGRQAPRFMPFAVQPIRL